jgi:hypothetical protein
MKEGMPEHSLQPGDLFADRALSQVQLFGSAGAAQVTCRGFEALQGDHAGRKTFGHIDF